MSSTEAGNTPIDNRSEQIEQNNTKSEFSEIGQYQKGIDSLLVKNNTIKQFDFEDISEESLSELFSLFVKSDEIKEVIASIDSDFEDGDFIPPSSEKVALLKKSVFDYVTNGLKNHLSDYAECIGQMEKEGKTVGAMNVMLVSYLTLNDKVNMALNNIPEYEYIAMKASFTSEQIMLAANEGGTEDTPSFISEKRAIVIDSVLSILSTLSPISSAYAEPLNNMRNRFEELKDQLDLGFDFPNEFLEKYESIKADFLGAIREHNANLKKRGKKYFTTVEDTFQGFNKFFQQVDLYIYDVGLQSGAGTDMEKIEKALGTLRKREKMADWSTMLTREIEVHAIVKATVERLESGHNVDSRDLNKAFERFGVYEGYSISYKRFTPLDDAKTLLKRAPSLKGVLNYKFMKQMEVMQNETDSLATKLFDSKELLTTLKRQVKEGKEFNKMLKALLKKGKQ